jgi:hypothetical protein
VAAAVAAALTMAGPARAGVFVIDNFDMTAPAGGLDWIEDSNGAGHWLQGNGVGSTIMNLPDGGGVWDRYYYAQLVKPLNAGEMVQTKPCVSCEAGHVSNSSVAVGDGDFWYQPVGGFGAATANVGDGEFSMDYSADLSGGDVLVTFYDLATFRTLHWGDLPAGMSMLSAHLPAGLNYGQVAWVIVDVFAQSGMDPRFGLYDLGREIPNLDVTIDDVKVTTPEPATLALMGVALLGLGARSRRRNG